MKIYGVIETDEGEVIGFRTEWATPAAEWLEPGGFTWTITHDAADRRYYPIGKMVAGMTEGAMDTLEKFQ